MRTLIITLITLLIALILSSSQSKAQENQDKTKERDLKKKQQELELKKKQQKELDSITEESQAKYDEELKALIKEQKRQQEEQKFWNDKLDEASKSIDFNNQQVYRIARPARLPIMNYYDASQFGSGDNTTFTISKHFKNTFTFSNDFEYEVPNNVTGLYFNFGAELESGTLKLVITKPDGKVFQTLTVSPIANVDWDKKFKIKENESAQFAGTWKITISTKEAKGYYELRINSY